MKQTFGRETRHYAQWTLYVMAMYVIGWGFTPYSVFFASIILGTAIGLFNMWSMYRDVKKIGNAAEKGEKAFTLGMAARLATGALAAVLYMQFPENFHLIGLVTGVMTPYIIILLHSLFKKKSM